MLKKKPENPGEIPSYNKAPFSVGTKYCKSGYLCGGEIYAS